MFSYDSNYLINFIGIKMLLEKVRENLNFKLSNDQNINFLFKNKIFQIKPLIKNKIFPKIEFGDFIIKFCL